MKTKEETEQFLQRFIGYGRTGMDKVFTQLLPVGQYLCATDAHIIVCLLDTFGFENDKDFKPVSVDRIFPVSDLVDIDVDFQKIERLYVDVEMIERFNYFLST